MQQIVERLPEDTIKFTNNCKRQYQLLLAETSKTHKNHIKRRKYNLQQKEKFINSCCLAPSNVKL